MSARKRRSRRGFSLAECLVTLLILSLMSALACGGISNALQSRVRAIRVADAQTVASTVAQAVADQLRYGQIAQVEDAGVVGDGYTVTIRAAGVVLSSGTYGAGVRLERDDQGRVVAQPVTASGGGYVPTGDPYALLGEKAYSSLALDELRFEADMDGEQVKSVRVELSVGVPAEEGETGSLWSLTYTVSPLNARMASL